MPRTKTNRSALAQSVKALRELGRIGPEDEATITAADRLAEAVDAAPGNAALWREYRAALAAVMAAGTGGGDDDDDGDDEFRTAVSTPVGNGSHAGA